MQLDVTVHTVFVPTCLANNHLFQTPGLIVIPQSQDNPNYINSYFPLETTEDNAIVEKSSPWRVNWSSCVRSEERPFETNPLNILRTALNTVVIKKYLESIKHQGFVTFINTLSICIVAICNNDGWGFSWIFLLIFLRLYHCLHVFPAWESLHGIRPTTLILFTFWSMLRNNF